MFSVVLFADMGDTSEDTPIREVVGPFDSSNEAHNWAAKNATNTSYKIVQLKTPKESKLREALETMLERFGSFESTDIDDTDFIEARAALAERKRCHGCGSISVVKTKIDYDACCKSGGHLHYFRVADLQIYQCEKCDTQSFGGVADEQITAGLEAHLLHCKNTCSANSFKFPEISDT